MAETRFPRSLPEFFRRFPDERSCLEFVVESRWPSGAACPRCSSGPAYPRNDRPAGWQCGSCGYVFSATSGTVMENTKLPLSLWLQAAYLMVTDKRGISAMQVQRDLGLKSYPTAYTLLQRLRAATVNPERERLHGAVEVDETFLGGVRHGRKGRELFGGKEGKFVVLGAIEVRPNRRPARLRLRHVEDLRARTLMRFVEDCVEPGTAVTTDGNPSYTGVARLGMTHRVQSTALGDPQEAVLRYLHLAFSNLKTWYAGTYHGRVEAKHLQGYLNEFCFRFNRRDDLFTAFRTVLGIAGRVPGPTRRGLYTTGPGRFVHPNPHDPEEPYG
jgi:transposase-like protein